MFEEELPESDSSDEDFVPDGDKSEVSEEDSDAAEPEEQEAADNLNTKKRKIKSTKSSRKKKKKAAEEYREVLKEKEPEPKVEEETPEEKKRKADAIWADFLKDCGPVVKKNSAEPQTSSSKNIADNNPSKSSSLIESTSNRTGEKASGELIDADNAEEENPTKNQTEQIVEVFEFAGEKVVVEKKLDPRKRPISRGGGAAAILNQLNKKTKLSTLEKSKLDWESFKSNEGINEELSAHNRGKNGYLEKQDFLERADLRQFEIEKQMRAYSRSKRV